ncbi:uncharacterized protein GBIM_06341 [Gryllus bimaculatus]|nr:uncharacterized protein GBIM_06341 [Gryllus bimaculatus]
MKISLCLVTLLALVAMAMAQFHQQAGRILEPPVPTLCAQSRQRYIWTSGRLCDFKGCERADLQPRNVNGWFWTAELTKLPPTTDRRQNDWSPSGGFNKPQPDNREFLQGGASENCLAILNNFYNDGVHWHDVACHHRKPWVCEENLAELSGGAGTGRTVSKPKEGIETGSWCGACCSSSTCGLNFCEREEEQEEEEEEQEQEQEQEQQQQQQLQKEEEQQEQQQQEQEEEQQEEENRVK